MNHSDTPVDQTEWQTLPQAEKKKQLFLKQKHMLDQFLSTGAISEAQYQKSLSDLTVKMGMEEALRADEAGQAPGRRISCIK